jgi:hypothetical protein
MSPDDEVIKIVRTKDGERHYGKVLDGTSWRYEHGAVRKALAGHPVTLAEAAAHGHATGHCLICGAELDENGLGDKASKGVQLSIARGVGPTCWKRLGGSSTGVTL